ncbi:hypothetical protein D3C80_1825090 [compost metagenome]
MSRDENNNKKDEGCGAAVAGRMHSGVGGAGVAGGQGESAAGRSTLVGAELQRASERIYRQTVV